MREVFHQTKNGLLAFAALSMKLIAPAVISSSIVSMRLRVSGPVSAHFCLPILPKRGSSVGSSLPVAKQCKTPRGPNLALKAGFFG